MYTRVVRRTSDGLVIRGAKLHISGASFGHDLMVMPTKNMKSGEEDYAVTCAVPVNSPGVRIVDVTYHPRGEDVRHFPISSKHSMPDGFVIFDDVFVPYERVFLVDAEYRMKLFHAIRDMTADSYGGWHLVTSIQAGGGLYSQRLVTRKHYDFDRARRLAAESAGVAAPG